MNKGIQPNASPRSAGHNRAAGAWAILATVLLAATAGGCRPATERDGATFRHNALGFRIDVPEGWTLTELDGDLAARLEGPSGDGPIAPVVHVFVRDEFEPVDLAAMADEVQRLAGIEAAVPGGAADAEPDDGPSDEGAADEVTRRETTVSGRSAVVITRRVAVRTDAVRTTHLVTARGKRAWVLAAAVAEDADESTRAAVQAAIGSFEVW